MVEALIARACPLIEAVRRRSRMQIGICRVGAVAKASLLAFTNAYCRTATSRFAFAMPNGYYGLVRIRIHIKAVIARLRNRERLVRRIHFVRLTVVQAPHMQVHRTLVRSEEHTSELQSRQYLVCRLLLEKKKHHRHRSGHSAASGTSP